ncbi:MAG: quinol:cytochrome C oxidoreductase [Bacteroidetes bacterium]|nr:quinol:cytochrome C oxidoreductase [Bacteroidota bacterium]
MENRFVFDQKIKIILFAMIAIGLVALVTGLVSNSVADTRFWANLLLNNYYFLALSLGGAFFVSVHAMGESGWHTSIQRVPEAMSRFIPVAGILMLITFLLGIHHLYHWTHTGHLDPILEGKSGYLNLPFFYIRFVVYFVVWTLLTHLFRKASVQMDTDPDIKYFKRQRALAAVFVVFFAVSSSTSSWDWLMSIDAHWFSTLYGWYTFSGLLVSTVAMMILIVIFLKKKGYMKHVNDEHMHDLGKYLFAFSILWMYLWFSQYMLMWYSNIPEETVYFVARLKDHSTLFYVNLIMNFLLPLLILMARSAKRMDWIAGTVAVVIIAGHWVDYFLAIMPGVAGENTNIGFFEIGLTIGYLGLFLMVVFYGLTKASLIPANHPYYKESLEYHTHY